MKDGIASFKGIPFAAPPVGGLRWKLPQPVESWVGTRKAYEFAPGCMQDTAFGAIMGGQRKISEDCFYLNRSVFCRSQKRSRGEQIAGCLQMVEVLH